jgi:hypothetical protein
VAILSVAVEAMGLLQTEMQACMCDEIQLNWKQGDGRYVTITVSRKCDADGQARYTSPVNQGD